ncbi:MAG TPA: biopolymer transporter ExbD [Fulvivirga sp.]|nr:biopolymer transporter ExbD [Fulvivirga sp.]
MRKLTRPIAADVNTSAASMADIAFFLLIFFMITTTIVSDKGLDLVLPPYQIDKPISNINQRNLFTILINSEDQLLVENKRRENYYDLREDLKAFILNNGRDKSLSDNPTSAVISIKTNRGTSQEMFLHVLDEAKAAYYEIYADKLSVNPQEVREAKWTGDKLKTYQKVRKLIPMNISVAEPD